MLYIADEELHFILQWRQMTSLNFDCENFPLANVKETDKTAKHKHEYIYIYMCVCVCVCVYYVLFGPVKPELGVIPSGQENYSKANM